MSEFNQVRLKAEIESLLHWRRMVWNEGIGWSEGRFMDDCALCKFAGHREGYFGQKIAPFCSRCPIVLSGQPECNDNPSAYRTTRYTHDTGPMLACLVKTIAWELSPLGINITPLDVKPLLPPDFPKEPKWEPKAGDWVVAPGGFVGFMVDEKYIYPEHDAIAYTIRIPGRCGHDGVHNGAIPSRPLDHHWFHLSCLSPILNLGKYLSKNQPPNFEAVLKYWWGKGEK